MKLISQAEGLISRTVRSVFTTFDDELVIAFTDGTFVALRSDYGYEGERYAPEIVDRFTIEHESDAMEFVEAGVITQAEFDEWKRIQKEKEVARRSDSEQRERREYERLRAKFGGSGSNGN